MTNTAKTLLVVGRQETGKTHYGVQLLGRLRQRSGKLSVRENPESIAIFEEGLRVLSQGMPADHTPTTSYDSVRFPLQFQHGQTIDLVWPDYGGEQISNLVEQRRLPTAWQQRVLESSGWLLFIRLEHNIEYPDAQSRPATLDSQQVEPQITNFQWSANAFYTELLQILLYAKSTGTLSRVKNPSLVILLSCWDEIKLENESTKPFELLSQRMPLFAEFIKSNWVQHNVAVFGLSSTGKALSKKTPDYDYIPEDEGYVVLPDGSKSSDLTLPLSELIEQAI
ncbi:MAG TPA: hypothetical protein P5280_03875 [Cyclobacteriaceae bacterium]|nr:hypothetical protein [Cyclobacteriaceae bacterium]